MTRIILIIGLVYGFVGLLLSISFYLQMAGTFTMLLLGIIIMIAFFVLGIMMFRKSNAGYSVFMDNIKLCFGIMFLGMFISNSLSFVYTSSIPEEKKLELQDNFIEKQLEFHKSIGLPATTEVEDQLISQAEAMFSLKAILMGLPIILGLYGILAFILSLILTKNPPEQNVVE